MKFINPFQLRPDTFIFHVRWSEILKPYPQDVRLEVYEAVSDYMTLGETECLKPLAAMAFSFIKFDLDRNLEAMTQKSEKCSAAGKASAGRRQAQAAPSRVESPAPIEPAPPGCVSPPSPRGEGRGGAPSLSAILDRYREQNRVTLNSWLGKKGISEDEFMSLGEAVLTEWQLGGWSPAWIETGKARYQSLDLLKWIATQKRIEGNETLQKNRLQRRRNAEPIAQSEDDYLSSPL